MKRLRDKERGFMGMLFFIDKKKPSKLRKLPFLPRIGIYIDIAGYEMIFKKVPFLEALINLAEQGAPVRNIGRVTKEQFAEVQFPKFRKFKVVNTSARTISVKTKD